MADRGAYQRVSTEKLEELSDKMARILRLSGGIQGVMWIVIGAVLIWYSTTIAETCSAPQLHVVYLGIGIADCFEGCSCLATAANAEAPADLLQHAILHHKYENEGRKEESEQQMDQVVHDGTPYALRAIATCCGTCICFITVLWLFVWGSSMLPQATSGCGDASTIFGAVLVLHIVVILLLCCISQVLQNSLKSDFAVSIPPPEP
mmetsp:Transcript_92908/g.248609  ORF Transcript_92908/g.248609 Transcript_92908/m.248609 type:complete len:206 (+) Transcript_92908:176-793(+)